MHQCPLPQEVQHVPLFALFAVQLSSDRSLRARDQYYSILIPYPAKNQSFFDSKTRGSLDTASSAAIHSSPVRTSKNMLFPLRPKKFLMHPIFGLTLLPRPSTVISLLLLFVVTAGPSFGGTVKSPEEIWKELENLAPAEREKKLVEGAKTESEMVWYTNSGIDNASPSIRPTPKAPILRT